MRIQPSFSLSLSPLPSSTFVRRTLSKEVLCTRASANSTKSSPAAANDLTTMNTAQIFHTFLRTFLSTLTFIIAFYGTTLLMSLLFPLDSALLGF